MKIRKIQSLSVPDLTRKDEGSMETSQASQYGYAPYRSNMFNPYETLRSKGVLALQLKGEAPLTARGHWGSIKPFPTTEFYSIRYTNIEVLSDLALALFSGLE